MLGRILKVLLEICLVIGLIAGTLIFLPRLITAWYARSRLFSISDAPVRRVAIVFGAGLLRDGSPTPVLRDRVAAAARLYLDGKVEKLLMSGDNRTEQHNEPGAMQTYAIRLGVPKADIVLDYAGWRTYDTCYRAREIFGVHQAILVTQSFHLPRALYLCNAMGISAVGVSADLRPYRFFSQLVWNLRELTATPVAFYELHFTHPLPVLGKPEPIFPGEAQ